MTYSYSFRPSLSIRAEASARVTGDWNNALTDTNVIRGRAGASNGLLDASSFLAEE